MYIPALATMLIMAIRPAYAESGFAVASMNQIKYGMWCGGVTYDEIKKIGYDCKTPITPTERLMKAAHQTLYDLVFAEAAEEQIKKDICIADTLKAIRENVNNTRTELAETLLTNYVSLKKARLVREQCEHHFYRSLPLDTKLRDGPMEAYEQIEKERSKPLPPELQKQRDQWKDACLRNKDTQEALENAEGIFLISLPNWRAPELLNLFDKHRDSVVDTRTGQPVTDKTLMAEDLRKLPWLSNSHFSQNFMAELESILKRHEEERRASAEGLKSGPRQTDQRDYLYDEETVEDILIKRHLAKYDKKGTLVPVSSGGACIMAWNEANMAGELAKYVAGGVGTGVVIGQLGRLAAGVNLSSKAKMVAGSAAFALGDGLAKTIHTCRSQWRSLIRVSQAAKDETKLQKLAVRLPVAVGYSGSARVNLPKVPSCEGVKGEQVSVDKDPHHSCSKEALEGLMNALPLTVSLPYMLLQ